MSEEKEENGEKDNKEDYRSVTTRDVLGSKSSKQGLLLLGLAVLCAFISIHQEIDTTNEEGVLKGAGVMKLEQKRSPIESTLELKLNSSDNSNPGPNITISDFELTYNRSLKVEDGELKEFNLTSDDYWLSYNLTGNNTLYYNQKVVYSHSPYRFLTVPAFILTIVGVVIFYRGKFTVKKEKELEKEGERERMKKEGEEEDKGTGKGDKETKKEKEQPKEPRKQFMGVDWGDIDEGEEIDREDE